MMHGYMLMLLECNKKNKKNKNIKKTIDKRT